MRIAILGNSGSGKSTLARWLAGQKSAALLDLDTIAWEPNQIAVPRSSAAAIADVRTFCRTNEHWVVEGCYAELVSAALQSGPRLVFMNPGAEQCIANCRSRPWEEHKYATKADQDQRLPFLLDWVRDYDSRDGDMSLSRHIACFRDYAGPKVALSSQPDLQHVSPEIRSWLSG